LDASVTAAKIAAKAITAAQVADHTITNGQIAAGTITTTELADGGVATNDLAANAVTAAKIAAGAVGTAALADGSITLAKLDPTAVQSSASSGDLKMSLAANPPTGWLLCDGRAVSRTTYAALFAAVGSTYGAGDGSTTFNLPDLRGRALVGAGTGSGLTNRPLGSNGGAETAAADLANHQHTISGAATNVTVNGNSTGISLSDPTHSHSLGGGNVPFHATGWSGATNVQQSGGSTNNIPYNNNTAVANLGSTSGAATGIGLSDPQHGHGVTDPQHTHTCQPTGSGGGHNNMQPYVAVNYFVKT